jgi:hypothetical protein
MNSTKKDMERDDIIKYRLANMLELAKKVNLESRTSGRDLIMELAGHNQYLRICGEAFTPVSLAENTPLSGYGNGQCTSLSAALRRFNRDPHPVSEETLKRKGERRLQNWLIREALRNGRSLKQAFSQAMQGFDDIIFALDEVSLGDRFHKPINRCDLLCVVLKDGRWRPLVVELKNRRIGDELASQVVKYAAELARFREGLDPLLQEVTQKCVAGEEILTMVIFPQPGSYANRARLGATYQLFDGIALVEYAPHECGYSFFPAGACHRHKPALTAAFPSGPRT